MTADRWYDDDDTDPVLCEVAREFCDAALLGCDLSELREVARSQAEENRREASAARVQRWRIEHRPVVDVEERQCACGCGELFPVLLPERHYPRCYVDHRHAGRARWRRWAGVAANHTP